MLDFDCEETAKDTAYHEAGHVVAGLGLGSKPFEVTIRADMTGEVEWLKDAEGQSIAQVRRKLIQVVAGPMAEWLSWAEDASYRLLSARIRRGETGDEDGRCDTSRAIYHGREVCRRLKMQEEGKWDERRVRNDLLHQDGWGGLFWYSGYSINFPRELPRGQDSIEIETTGPITPPEVTSSEILAEVVRAERWAKRLLIRRWRAVVEVAEALYESPEGVLSHDDVMWLVAGESSGATCGLFPPAR